jgi:hypothetical protein
MRYALTICALLAGCADPIETAYNAKVAEAKADCRAKGGDEFKPYGFDAWRAAIALGRPATFRCQRLEKNWKRGIAVYALRRDGDRIVMEVR